MTAAESARFVRHIELAAKRGLARHPQHDEA
jgi:hypothetical protein